ncbi:HNH endonuclease signature motif containing protein [Paenibacillus xanthanilyticus]|uniref:HNH endonuclease signature motif containing protein n=1 Tax=Paenibacillus xanthanilyticus TaxID=1783531 RepID=A0ABV8K5A3_9BACL
MAKQIANVGRCALCGRDEVERTEHHLTPKEMGGTFMETVLLCRTCHRQIHALYTNEDLVRLGLTTIEALLADERVAAYVKYIRKQPPGVLPKVRKSARVRER